MDEDGNKNLSLEEFKVGLEETGLELSDDEINDIFQKFDVNGDGNISINEFIESIRVGIYMSQFYIHIS